LGRRGSILLHVMVTGALLALIAATLLRMSMLRYQMGGRGASVLAEKRDDQGALANVLAAWNANNAVCSAVPTGYSCGALSAGTCNCSCSTTLTGGGTQVVSASVIGGVCTLSITSPDL
jgi:hypothetical protein